MWSLLRVCSVTCVSSSLICMRLRIRTYMPRSPGCAKLQVFREMFTLLKLTFVEWQRKRIEDGWDVRRWKREIVDSFIPKGREFNSRVGFTSWRYNERRFIMFIYYAEIFHVNTEISLYFVIWRFEKYRFKNSHILRIFL